MHCSDIPELQVKIIKSPLHYDVMCGWMQAWPASNHTSHHTNTMKKDTIKMTKYLFFSVPGQGHVNPTLAVVQELVARGEQVVYYLSEEYRSVIEATGAEFQPYESELFKRMRQGGPPSFARGGFKGFAAAGGPPPSAGAGMLPVMMIKESTQLLPMLLEKVRAEQPDCIVYGSLFFVARLVAQVLNIPAVTLYTSYAMNEHFNLAQRLQNLLSPDVVASLNEQLSQLGATYNLPGLNMRSLMASQAGLHIAFIPRAFQPKAETFDPQHYIFTGPSLQEQRSGPQDFPFDRLDARPHLYISLGTVFNNQVEFYKACIAAFANSEWQVILSHGRRVQQEQLGAIPENFIVVPFVPQLEILPRTSIFISHGGMNSVMESLYYGVPLIVVPQMPEQYMNGQRVQELGLGVALDTDTVTPDILREAVQRVAQEPSYRDNVRAMQQNIHESGGYKQAADALIAYMHR